jgi:hypothetical protein
MASFCCCTGWCIYKPLGFKGLMCEITGFLSCLMENKMYFHDAKIMIHYHKYLYMFRARVCPSSGLQVVCYCIWCWTLGVVAVVLRRRCVVLCTVGYKLLRVTSPLCSMNKYKVYLTVKTQHNFVQSVHIFHNYMFRPILDHLQAISSSLESEVLWWQGFLYRYIPVVFYE